MAEDFIKYFEANKEAWNKRTAIHKDSAFYDVPSFMAGATSLQKIEMQELGDLTGKKVLHLQCHFGLDTLSLVRMGAAVTGVDLSDTAIKYARELNDELKLDAGFICCNLYDLPLHLKGDFDIVFTSYGVIGWLPDLDKWASVVAHFLKPGGAFHMIEFHPVVWMFDEQFKYIKYSYHNAETIAVKQTATYANPDAEIEYDEFSWNHSLSEVVNALISKGLQIKHLNEFSYSSYNCFANTIKGADGNYTIKGMEGKIPMTYSIKAVKNL